jgi:voltage-gated potassium channel
MNDGRRYRRHWRGLRGLILALPATILMPFGIVARALRGIWDDRTSRGILIVAVWLLIGGTVLFMLIEGFSPIDSFYFCFITLATIGYGDLSPRTDIGKLVTVIYSIGGLGIMAALISSIASQRLAAYRDAAGLEDAESKDDTSDASRTTVSDPGR